MKQLKFMLAAATAIGLATAAQAATTPLDSEDFESAALKDDISKLTGFYYSGVAADNESEVVSDGASGQALKVNTGTVPVLRALKNGTGAAIPQSLKEALSVNVDTMVQFTVTPAGDPVTATSGDKLMIYLKETATTTTTGEGDEAVETTTYATNLVVKAAKYSEADTAWVEGGDDYVVTLPAGMEAVTTDKWYRLVVKAKAYVYGTDDDGNPNSWWPVFQVYLASATDTVIDADDLCTFEDVDGAAYAVAGVDTGDDAVNSVFVSLAVSGADGEGVESSALALESVGFAGEGMVDNLVFTKEIEGATSVDFTLALGEGVSSVKFTIGEDSYTLDAETTAMTIEGLDLNSKAVITEVKYADYYIPADGDLVKDSEIALNAATVSKVVKASTKLAEVKGEVTPDVAKTEYKVAENAQIFTSTSDNATEAGAEITSAQIAKILDWNNRVNGGKIADVNSMKFVAGEPDGNSAEAYLLNCSTAELAKEKEEFKFSPEDLASLMTSGLSATGLDADKQKYIGEFVLEGASALNGEATDWKDSAKWTGEEKPAFYRARLIFK